MTTTREDVGGLLNQLRESVFVELKDLRTASVELLAMLHKIDRDVATLQVEQRAAKEVDSRLREAERELREADKRLANIEGLRLDSRVGAIEVLKSRAEGGAWIAGKGGAWIAGILAAVVATALVSIVQWLMRR